MKAAVHVNLAWLPESRNLGRLDGAGWSAASFRFEHPYDESSSQLEAAQMATKRKPGPSAPDFWP